jgi:predicted phosphatase
MRAEDLNMRITSELNVAKASEKLEMFQNRLYLFDFDETLTFLSTNKNPNATSRSVYEAKLWECTTPTERENFYRENMKPQVAELFRGIWELGATIGIPTFSNAPDEVYAHFRAIGLTDREIRKIIIEFRPENFDPSTTKKDTLVLKILERANSVIGEVIFCDDSKQHIDEIQKTLGEMDISCRTFLVPRSWADTRKITLEFIDTLMVEIKELKNACQTDGTPLPNQTQIKRFYIFDRDDTLIDDRGQLINPQFISPFVQTILHESTFAWAIASAGATELEVDPFYKAISIEMEISKKPAYIQFNQINSLIAALINIDGLEIKWDPTEENSPQETKAKIIFNMLLETKELMLYEEIKWRRSKTSFIFTPEASLQFKFGNTIIIFNANTLFLRINDLEKGDCKLFFIFLAMDKMELRPKLSQELIDFGVQKIQSPESYVTINSEDVVFVDDRKNNCEIIAEAGFTAIIADTEAASRNRNYLTTNSYLSNMELTLPEPIRKLFNVSNAFNSLSDHDLNRISYEEIQNLRNSALNILKQLRPYLHVEQLWAHIQRL